MQTWEILIHLLLHYCILLLSEKQCIYNKNIQYAYNFCETDSYGNVCRGVFRTQLNIYGGDSFRTSQENFIADVRLGAKYASGIGFTAEKVYRMSTFT